MNYWIGSTGDSHDEFMELIPDWLQILFFRILQVICIFGFLLSMRLLFS